MVYSNKFVMCVLLNGRPQKELANGQVSLPFGTEYALRFRNKNNRRAVVQIYIDGENVSGAGYIVNAHDYVDIKRHHDVDRSFKFVSLDSEDAIEHGKNGPNDDKVKGTIEARFYLEKEQPQVIYRDIHHDHHHHHYDPPRPIPMPRPPYTQPTISPIWYSCDNGGLEGGMTMSGGTTSNLGPTVSNTRSASFGTTADAYIPPSDALQDGATVEGNLTGQSFRSVWCDTETSYTSLKIFLQGYEDDEVMVAKPKKAVKPTKIVKPTKPKKKAKPKNPSKAKRLEIEELEKLEEENRLLKEKIEHLERLEKFKEARG